MGRSLTTVLRRLDAFGPSIHLNFRGDETFQTVRGGLIFLVFAIFTGWQVLISLQRLYLQSDPVIASYEIEYKDTEKQINLIDHL